MAGADTPGLTGWHKPGWRAANPERSPHMHWGWLEITPTSHLGGSAPQDLQAARGRGKGQPRGVTEGARAPMQEGS